MGTKSPVLNAYLCATLGFVGVRADLNKRVLHALADAVADDPGYAFTGVDVREGWGDIVFVTIYGESIDGTPGPGGRALVQAVESAIDPERRTVRLETVRRP
jgi:hypothetical protein